MTFSFNDAWSRPCRAAGVEVAGMGDQGLDFGVARVPIR